MFKSYIVQPNDLVNIRVRINLAFEVYIVTFGYVWWIQTSSEFQVDYWGIWNKVICFITHVSNIFLSCGEIYFINKCYKFLGISKAIIIFIIIFENVLGSTLPNNVSWSSKHFNAEVINVFLVNFSQLIQNQIKVACESYLKACQSCREIGSK